MFFLLLNISIFPTLSRECANIKKLRTLTLTMKFFLVREFGSNEECRVKNEECLIFHS